MKSITKILVFCLLTINGFSQENFNLELIANIPVGEAGSDVWGYVDQSGLEYAIMGTFTQTKIWSLEDPANPILRASIPGPAGRWRDIKSFEDHLYVTADQGAEGLLIVDMSNAPDSISSVYWRPIFEMNGIPDTLDKCHNLYIDTDQGFCYLAGCDVSKGGVLILDLKVNKKEPILVGIMDNNNTHDVFVKNDKMYTSDIYIGSFNIYDISDKTNPKFINGSETSKQFTHNAWLSDDENYLFTTDERANAWVDAYDISDSDEIQLIDRYRPLETEGEDVVPHNTHFMNGFLITSWYTDGIVILDAHEPDNLIKVGAFDTEEMITEGFWGCWGAYPFLPSGIILASDKRNGLFVLQPKNQDGQNGYQRACYIQGNVTNIETGAAIANANIKIISNSPNKATSGITGNYKTGQITTGEFQVEFSHPNFESKTLAAVLESGKITILDAQLGKAEISGTVTDNEGNPIENVSIIIKNSDLGVEIITLTDENGQWVEGVNSAIEYEVYSAKWGYKGAVKNINLDDGSIVDFELEKGYEDDFYADLGWQRSGSATSGFWEIAKPNLIIGYGQITQMDSDIPLDIGDTYYITGASGAIEDFNLDDIDNGNVILTSPPMDFTDFDRIDFSYYLWFANVGGVGNKNDFLTVNLTNGIDQIELTRINQNSSKWSSLNETSVENTSFDFNDNMRIIVYAEDVSPEHVTEAGFDAFKATGIITSTNVNEISQLGISLFPNPSQDMITINTQTEWEGIKQLTITNALGQKVIQKNLDDLRMQIDIQDLAKGLYSLQIIGNYKQSETIIFTKI